MQQWLGRMLLKHIGERAVGLVTADGRFVTGEARGARFGGSDPVALEGRLLAEFYVPEKRTHEPRLHLAEAEQKGLVRVRGEWVGLDDRRFAGDLAVERLDTADEPLFGWLLLDRTDQQRAAAAQQALAAVRTSLAAVTAQRDELQQILQSLGHGVLDVDPRRRTESPVHGGGRQHDTVLLDRSRFADRLTEAVAHARHVGHMLGVLLLDIDTGAADADSAEGLLLMRRVADVVERRLRPNDTIGLLAGHRLAMVLDGLDRLDGAARLADDLLAALAELAELMAVQREPASIGVAILGADGETAEELITAAEGALAMAVAGEYRYANAALHDQVVARRTLEAELRRALEEDQFRIHYQPVVDTRDGRTVGVEGLLRWEHPQRGLVTAGEFLPIAAGTDMILPLGDWALRELCAQARAWRAAGVTDVCLTMNLPDAQLRSEALPALLLALLAEHGLPPEAIELEITEAQLLREGGVAEEMCRRLKNAGLSICIDDFSAGYGPIGALVALAVRKVKIHPALIARLDTLDGAEADSSLDAILQLAHVFHLGVVAKGVESDRQLAYLQSHGCHAVQGFCVGRPVPAAQLSASFRAALEQDDRV